MPERERTSAHADDVDETYDEAYDEEEYDAETGAGPGRPERRPYRAARSEQHTDEGAGSRRLHGEVAGSEEGIAGEGTGESGTLPGSTAGVTGAGGHSGGTQSPGAKLPGFPGLSPDEAERLRREGRRRSEEQRE